MLKVKGTGIEESRFGRFARLFDPDGNRIE
jgi:hypothetical protein